MPSAQYDRVYTEAAGLASGDPGATKERESQVSGLISSKPFFKAFTSVKTAA
jgi:hypothetical protein